MEKLLEIFSIVWNVLDKFWLNWIIIGWLAFKFLRLIWLRRVASSPPALTIDGEQVGIDFSEQRSFKRWFWPPPHVSNEWLKKNWLIALLAVIALAVLHFLAIIPAAQEAIMWSVIGIICASLLLILIVLFRSSPAEIRDAKYYAGNPNGTEFAEVKKQELYERAGHRCEDCGCHVLLGKPDGLWEWILWRFFNWKIGHAHHKIPFSHGGQGDLNNGEYLCDQCNFKLSDQITDESIAVAAAEGETIENN